MADNITGINYTTTTSGVGMSSGNNQGPKPEVEEEKTDVPAPAPEKTQYTADEIFAIMNMQAAMNGASVAGACDIDPTQYLSAERIAEIEASMGTFELALAKALAAVSEEFPDLSDEAKLELAASMID